MKNKKILIYYLSEFVLSIFVFLTLILLILKMTILNKAYLVKILDNNNYYHELYLDINNDFENYIMQSGFDNSIVDNLFTEEDLEKIIHQNVDNFFKGKSIVVDTGKIESKLTDNINIYLDNNNIKITDDDSLNLFKEEIINIYRKRIVIDNKLIKLSDLAYKVIKSINILFIILFILDIILILIIKKIFKKITLTIPLLTSIFLLSIGYFLLIEKININNIVFWNSYLSNVIKNIFTSIKDIIKYFLAFGISLEIVKLLIIYIRKSRKI